MQRPAIVRFGIRLPALLIAGTLGACTSRPERPPNVVLVTIESLRADHVGAYGGRSRTRPDTPLTPSLDALATESTVYEDAHAVTSWTLASHASLFTGLYPTAHRTVEPRDRLDDSYLTLAEVLHGIGYQTIGLASGPYLRRPFNLSQGFETWDDSMATVQPGAAHGDRTNAAMAEAWKRALAQRDSSRPLFLFAYFWDPHYDYLPPPPYDRLFVTPACEAFDLHDYEHRTDLGPDLAPARLAYLWSQYEGEVRATDAVLGELFESLRAQGLWDDSLIIVTADHGEEFLEHGYTGHKNHLHAETVHVPLLIKYPRTTKGGRDARLASLIDVFPTVLAVTGAHTSGHLDGHSLADPPVDDRAILFELVQTGTTRRRPDGTRVPGQALWGGMRTATRKLMWASFAPDGAATDTDTELAYVGLFDVAGDPGELHNLGETDPDETKRLAERFQAESAGARAEADRHPRAGKAVLDGDAIERLRALGYVGD